MVWKPHTTVAAIIERDNKFLMVEELVNNKRVFNQPAGHLDPDESLIDAVIRETLEETAWNFTPEAITGIYLWKHPDNGESFLRVAFCGSGDNHQPQLTLDDGIIQAIWMSRDELNQLQQQLRSPMVIDCIDDYSAGKRFPMDMLVDVTS
jgi:NADH pyrophosphatase NudC (nudix superfamily)